MLYCERRYAIGNLFRSTSELTHLTSWFLLAGALVINIHETKIKKFGLSSYLHSIFLRKDAYSIAEDLLQLDLFKKPKEIKSSSINEEKLASNALLYTKPIITWQQPLKSIQDGGLLKQILDKSDNKLKDFNLLEYIVHLTNYKIAIPPSNSPANLQGNSIGIEEITKILALFVKEIFPNDEGGLNDTILHAISVITAISQKPVQSNIKSEAKESNLILVYKLIEDLSFIQPKWFERFQEWLDKAPVEIQQNVNILLSNLPGLTQWLDIDKKVKENVATVRDKAEQASIQLKGLTEQAKQIDIKKSLTEAVSTAQQFLSKTAEQIKDPNTVKEVNSFLSNIKQQGLEQSQGAYNKLSDKAKELIPEDLQKEIITKGNLKAQQLYETLSSYGKKFTDWSGEKVKQAQGLNIKEKIEEKFGPIRDKAEELIPEDLQKEIITKGNLKAQQLYETLSSYGKKFTDWSGEKVKQAQGLNIKEKIEEKFGPIRDKAEQASIQLKGLTEQAKQIDIKKSLTEAVSTAQQLLSKTAEQIKDPNTAKEINNFLSNINQQGLEQSQGAYNKLSDKAKELISQMPEALQRKIVFEDLNKNLATITQKTRTLIKEKKEEIKTSILKKVLIKSNIHKVLSIASVPMLYKFVIKKSIASYMLPMLAASFPIVGPVSAVISATPLAWYIIDSMASSALVYYFGDNIKSFTTYASTTSEPYLTAVGSKIFYDLPDYIMQKLKPIFAEVKYNISLINTALLVAYDVLLKPFLTDATRLIMKDVQLIISFITVNFDSIYKSFLEWWNQPSDFMSNIINFLDSIVEDLLVWWAQPSELIPNILKYFQDCFNVISTGFNIFLKPLFNKLSENITNALHSIAHFALISIESLNQTALNAIEGFKEWWNQPSDFIPNIINFFSTFALNFKNVSETILDGVVKPFLGKLTEVITDFIGNWLKQMATDIYYSFSSQIKVFIDAFFEWWNQPSDLIPNIIEFISNKSDILITELWNLIKIAKNVFDDMFTIVSPLILRSFETAVNIIKNSLNFVAQSIEGLKDGVLFYANAFIEWWNQPSDFIPNLIKFSEQILYKIIDSTSPYITPIIDQFYKALHEIIEPNIIKFINLSISTIKNITYYIFEGFSFFKEHVDKALEWWSQPSDIIPNIINYFNERFEKYKSEIYDALKIGKTTLVVTLDTIIKPSLLKLYSVLADELNNNTKYILDIFVSVKDSFVYNTNEFIEWWNQPSDFIPNSIKFLQETFDTISKAVVNITTGVFTTTYETLVKPVLIPLLSNSAKFIVENSNYALEATAGKVVEIYKQVGQDIELVIEKITNFDILKLATSIEEFFVDNWLAKGVVVGISKYLGSTTSEFIIGTLSSKSFDILNENLKHHLYQDKSDTLSSTEEIINKIYLDMEGVHISQHELEGSLYNISNSVENQSPYMDDTLCYDNIFLNDQLLHTPDTHLDHHIKISEALIKF